MFNKTDEIPPAATENEKIAENAVEQTPTNAEATEPENLNGTGAGFRYYITHPPTAEDVIQRMKDFPKRREAFIAAVRKGTDRDISS